VASLPCEEGAPFRLDPTLRPVLRAACARLEQRLRPSFSILEERAGEFILRGVIGTVELRPGVLLDIAPKVTPGDGWIDASLDLLLPATRIDIAGDRRGGMAAHRNLLDVLAAIYAERLTWALRRDGPLLLMERRSNTLGVLKGKLSTTDWVRRAAWQPHRLPVTFQELTADNAFTRAMSHVAQLLARHSADARVRGRLLTAARELRPGAPEDALIDPRASLRALPTQWAAYGPAWDVTVSVLSRRTLLGVTGQRRGVSVVVEAWRLLETLLERSLQSTVRHAREHGFVLAAPKKHQTHLLEPHPGSVGKRSSVEPDGRLEDADGRNVATFETKYSRGLGVDPPREHVFQALTTAAACRSPLAVLVYPDRFEPVWWSVEGFNRQPATLAAIGLHLFGYRRGTGDRERGGRIYELLAGPAADASGVAP
jgi:hypothetical protein